MKDFLKRALMFSSKPIKYKRQPTHGPVAPKTYDLPDRDIKIREDSLNELKPVLFGELSNDNYDRQVYEAQQIANTAINRIPQYAERGKNMNLAGVLSAKNQYQAYQGNEYNRYKQGSTTPVDAQKMKAIDKVVQQIREGTLYDNTGNRVFYIHDEDGTLITADGPLYK